jgi:KAP family P-loop domain
MKSKGVKKLSELRNRIHLLRVIRWVAGLFFILLCIVLPLIPHKELEDLLSSNDQSGPLYYLAFVAIIVLITSLYNKEFGGISICNGRGSAILFFIIIATLLTFSPTIVYLFGNEQIISYFYINKSSYELLLLFIDFISLAVFIFCWRKITELSSKENIHRNKLISNGHANREVPINDKSGDLFGFQKRAEFLAQQVESGQNIMITGEWGSGKSSLCNLISNELKRNTDIKTIICKINCWGNRIQNFDETLLNSILLELKQHCDTFFVSNVPSLYMNGFRSSDNWLKNLIGFILPNRIPPCEVLAQLDSMLIHNKIRVIITVEDADRNEDKEFINKVVAPMLDSLNHLINIKFLFTITEGSIVQNHEMISRIVALKHVIIPPSEKFYILELYKFTRNLISSADDVILPDEKNIINRLFGQFDGNYSSNNEIYIDGETYPRINRIVDSGVSMAYYLTSLIKSYRDFKFVLRDIEFRWNQIKGQVDLCDLIAFRMLEKFDIKIYDFVANKLNKDIFEYEKSKNDEVIFLGEKKSNFEHLRFKKIIYFFENTDKRKNPQSVALQEDKYHLRVLFDCIPQGKDTGDQAIFRILNLFEIGEINQNCAIEKLYSLTHDEEFVRLWNSDLSKFQSYQLVAEFIGRYGCRLSQLSQRLNLLRELVFIICDVKIKTVNWDTDNAVNEVLKILLDYYNNGRMDTNTICDCVYNMLEITYMHNLTLFCRFYRSIVKDPNIPSEFTDKLKSLTPTIIQIWNKDPIMLIKASPLDDILAISRLSNKKDINIPWGKLFSLLKSKGLSKAYNDILTLQFIGYFMNGLELIYNRINKIELQRPGEGICYNVIRLPSGLVKIWIDIMKNVIGQNNIKEFCIIFSEVDTEYLISTYFPNKSEYYQTISTIRNSKYYAREILYKLRVQENTNK